MMVEAASPALIEKVRTATTDGEGRYRIYCTPCHGRLFGGERRQHRVQLRVDVRAILAHARQRRTREQAAPIARVARSDRLVIRVEKEREVRIEHAVARYAAQHELLEEPAGVRQMPFDRTRIRHRLQCAILVR